MGKEIKISIKDIDKLEFYLDEDAQKGDWICLKADWTNLKETLELKKNKIIDEWKKQILPELKKQVIDDYQLHNTEYLELKKKEQQLNNYEEKKEQDIKFATLKLEEENKKLLAEIKTYQVTEEKNKAEFQNKLTEEIKNHQKEIVEDSVLYKELQNKNKELLNENNILTATNNNLIHSQKNTKWVGEQLEQWIYGEWEDKLSMSLGNAASFEKATKNIKDETIDEKKNGTKPDFIFSVYKVTNGKNKDEPPVRELLEKVVIEAKNEAITTPANHQVKNSTHFQTLEDNRKKNDAKFAILVTELEKDKNFSIALPDPVKYPNMFMVRPEWLMSLLSLLYYIIIKEAQIYLHIKKNEKFQKDKEALRKRFDDFRTKLLDTNFKNIRNRLSDISEYADDIIEKAEKIKNAKNTIIETHIQAIESKVNKFNIDSMCKKIDKINKQEDSLMDDDDDSDEEENDAKEIEFTSENE